MCGFAGIYLFNKFNRSDYNKMSNELKFRGPDEFGEFIDIENQIAFFHQRLSILDLTKNGSQPMESFSSRFVIAYNGEIYNHLDIRKIINENNNINWKGSSDTETLLNAIEIFGINKALNICTGVFSFVLWDKKNKELSLARDKLGEKPLYYGFNNSIFFFGSDLFPFKKSQLFVPKINEKSLKVYFNLNYIPAPYTIYKDIHKLSGGEYITISSKNKNLNPIKYWKLEKNKNFNFNKIDKIEYFKNKVEESVKRQTISDVPIGSFLSGGIDSSIVSYFMQKNSLNKIKTFNVSFEDSEYDESFYAKEIANFIGTDHHTLKLSRNSFTHVLTKLNDIFSEPFSDSSQIVTYLISNFAKKNVSVILSGDGGDEGFSGYNRHLIAKKINTFNKLIPFFLRKKIFNFLERNNYKNLGNLLSVFKKLNKQVNVKNISHRYHKITRSLLSNDLNELYLNFFINRPNFFINNELNNINYIKENLNLNLLNLNDILFYDIKYYLSDDIMCKVDRASMANSLETRMPLADANIISDTLGLDYKDNVKNNTNKYILKKISQNIFPENLIKRPKMGFEIPLNNLLKTSFKEWAEDLIYSSQTKKNEFINFKNLESIWNEHKKNNSGYHHELWNILIYLNWSINNK